MTAKTKEKKYSVFDFDKPGKKALVAPFCLVIVLACVLSLAVAPLLQASPHDVSRAIVNLDDGVATPAGTANAGAMLASQLTGEEDEAAQESTAAMAAIAKVNATTSNTETAADAADAAGASAAMADSLTWETFDAEDELHAQLDDNNVFGGIVIPADPGHPYVEARRMGPARTQPMACRRRAGGVRRAAFRAHRGAFPVRRRGCRRT